MNLLTRLKALFQRTVSHPPRGEVGSYRLTCYSLKGYEGTIIVAPDEMSEDQVMTWQQEMEYHRGLVTIVTRIYAP